MRFPRILVVLTLVLTFSFTLFAQELPESFGFKKDGPLVYQVEPKPEAFLKFVTENGPYQGVGIAAGLRDNLFAVVLVNAVPEKGDYIFEKQKKEPITITVDGEKVSGVEFRTMEKKKEGKAKFEIAIATISEEAFEKMLAANKVYVEFGKFNHLASAENLQAFRYLSAVLEKEEDLRDTSSPAYSSPSSEIRVKGYYRKDGTYVKPHSRKRPKN